MRTSNSFYMCCIYRILYDRWIPHIFNLGHGKKIFFVYSVVFLYRKLYFIFTHWTYLLFQWSISSVFLSDIYIFCQFWKHRHNNFLILILICSFNLVRNRVIIISFNCVVIFFVFVTLILPHKFYIYSYK